MSDQREHAMIPDGHGRMVPVPGAFNPVPAVMRNLRERYGTLHEPPCRLVREDVSPVMDLTKDDTEVSP